MVELLKSPGALPGGPLGNISLFLLFFLIFSFDHILHIFYFCIA